MLVHDISHEEGNNVERNVSFEKVCNFAPWKRVNRLSGKVDSEVVY